VLVALEIGAGARAQTRPAPATPPPAPGIDLNSASRDELMSLEGIGEVKADAIIRARPFKAKTELVERRIVPEALYDRINARLTVRPMPGTPPAPAAPTPRR
jgi:DNA uptake protein ComE-like DNA-binding protein